ncbi:conserved hypothetical protein [Beggiatoa sp. PS]|nr:conserved hypothetical protein [Beggiatoa sp. PS]
MERKRKEWAQRETSLERQRADQEQERAEKLAEKLRALGINPDEIA